MDVLEAIYHRRAIRSFTSEAVDKGLIELLVDAAIHAPNALDKQRWAFVILRDRALMARISGEAKTAALQAFSALPELKELRAILADAAFNIFYDAPTLIVICGTEDDAFVAHDCCLAAQNLMLAAHERKGSAPAG